jgi:hypothetical protein
MLNLANTLSNDRFDCSFLAISKPILSLKISKISDSVEICPSLAAGLFLQKTFTSCNCSNVKLKIAPEASVFC